MNYIIKQMGTGYPMFYFFIRWFVAASLQGGVQKPSPNGFIIWVEGIINVMHE